MRKAARIAAVRFTWSSVLDRALFPLLRELGVPFLERPIPFSARRREEPVVVAPMQPAPAVPEYAIAATRVQVAAVARPVSPA
jgi:hypothetical protein